MLSVKEITALRRSGQLQQAHEQALLLMDKEPGPWSCMAMFWVLRDMGRQLLSDPSEQARQRLSQIIGQMKDLQPQMVDDAHLGLQAIEALEKEFVPHHQEARQLAELSKTNPADAYSRAVALMGNQGQKVDKMLHEELGWIIYRYLKARTDQLTSVQVRSLLRDYIKLGNERPSLLHSMILSFAVNASKLYSDFNFSSFFILWGIGNLRKDDCMRGHIADKEIPALIERVCGALAMSVNPLVNELAKAYHLKPAAVVNTERKYYFWHLNDLQKQGKTEDFWRTASNYANKFIHYVRTIWHSQVISLITRHADAAHAAQFFSIVCQVVDAGLASWDFEPEKADDGNVYPPTAVKVAKACFEMVKTQPHFKADAKLMQTIAALYDLIHEHHAGDEWTERQRAIVCAWTGNKNEALRRYKELLVDLGDKYYVWQEAAQLIDDLQLRAGMLACALRLEKTENLIGPVRLQMAGVLTEEGHLAQARQQLKIYAANRQKEGKQCPQPWHELNNKLATIPDKGALDIHKVMAQARDFAYSDFPWHEYVVQSTYEVTNKKTGKTTQKTRLASGDSSFSISSKMLKNFPVSASIGTVVEVRLRQIGGRTILLDGRGTDKPLWSALPIRYGYVAWIDPKSENSLVQVADLTAAVFVKSHKCDLKIGDFVSLNTYKNGEEHSACNVSKCDKATALPHFKQATMVVDGVNEQKKLYHVTDGDSLGAIIPFSQVQAKFNEGDLLSVAYARYRDKKDKWHMQILDISTSSKSATDLVREVEGELIVKQRRGKIGKIFGFVGGIYVPGYLLDKSGIVYDYESSDDCTVRVAAIKCAGRKWRAITLDIVNDWDEHYDENHDENYDEDC